MKVGDIVEQTEGPYRVTSHSSGRCGGYTSYTPVYGPLTKQQYEYCEYAWQRKERCEKEAAALRGRIVRRLRDIPTAILPRWDGSEEFVKPLIDLIVELIHEESDYCPPYLDFKN